MPGDTAGREREFWDDGVPQLGECLDEYHRGPDPNTAAMLDAVEPLAGLRVLDFACGGGVTSAWLAARGAHVTGIDLSPRSIERAQELCAHLGLTATFVAGEVGEQEFPAAAFERIVGRYALHHVEVDKVGPILASLLVSGGKAAFLETMATNPLLRVTRRHLVGRFGVPRYGTRDEHPLTQADLDLLESAFGRLELDVAKLSFLRIFDRQLLHYRSRMASTALGSIDDLIKRCGWTWMSYHQVVSLIRV